MREWHGNSFCCCFACCVANCWWQASPVDGRVLVCGEVSGDQVEQVKGVTYSLSQFLGCPLELLLKYPQHSKKKVYHCILYLSPGDYHRIHFPADWTIKLRRHFPGTPL